MSIELCNISKTYGPVHANRSICMRIAPGAIHGILGENGAGKSTLMKILAGYLPKSGGTILLDGRPVDYASPVEAAKLGIGMLYQDSLDFLSLSVLDNFILGQPSGWRIDSAAFRARLLEMAAQFGFELNPDAPVEKLTAGERQQLELLRLLSLGARVLILDEPTAGISGPQKDLLFGALRRLASQGKTVCLVSHNLEDIDALCDAVTVLRQGEVVGEMSRPFATRELLELMFGTLPEPPERDRATPGEELLAFRAVSAAGGRSGLKECTVTIREREVVGLAGLQGSGEGLFLRLAAGMEHPTAGAVSICGRTMNGADHLVYRDLGVAYLPSARLEEGLMPDLTITEHYALTDPGATAFIGWSGVQAEAQRRIDHFSIRGTPGSPAQTLSGGNQQRLLISLIPAASRLLLLDQPTRGLDIESTHWIWRHLKEFRDRNGAAVIFSSTELDEILMVADRILVFCNGRVVRDVRTEEADPKDIGKAIAGKG